MADIHNNEPAVVIDGHEVPARLVDQFFSGRDGRRVTDAEWDEAKRRVEDAEMLDTDPDNPLVTWEPYWPEVSD